MFKRGGLKKFGGRRVSKQTRKAARKLMRGQAKVGGTYSRQTQGLSRKQRKRQAVAQVYDMKRMGKFGNDHQSQLGGEYLADLGVERASYKNGGYIQHD